MIKFEKVSFNEYVAAVSEFRDITNLAQLREEWESINLPKRATSGSAGYDFFAPVDMNIYTEQLPAKVYPTGIRFVTDNSDIVLMCVPRSGLGFKHGLRLYNTAGIIDSDYQFSDNEGHIKVKMSADKPLMLKQGSGFMQGIILPYLKVDDDNCIKNRNGGFGSTDN